MAVLAGLFQMLSFPAGAESAAPEAAWLQIADKDVVARQTFEGGRLLTQDEALEIPLELPSAGDYRVALIYEQTDYPTFGNSGEIRVNDEATAITLGGVWYDMDEERQLDRYGNETISNSAFAAGKITQYLSDDTDYDHVDSVYSFRQGSNTIHLTFSEVPVTVYEVLVVKKASYSGLSKSAVNNGQQIPIQAEDYVWKSDSYIHAGNAQDPDVTPYQVDKKKINILDGAVFDTHRQKVLYQFYVEAEGDYQIALRYNQDSKKGMSVYRNIEIDGQVPDACFENISFKYTGLDYQTQTVTNGDEPAYIHLTEGWHTLSVIVSSTPVASYQERLNTTLHEIGEAGIAVKMITGGQKDQNRTWNIEEYLPTIVDDLNRWADELDAVYDELEALAGRKPSFAASLPKSAQYLRKAAAHELLHAGVHLGDKIGCVFVVYVPGKGAVGK